MAVNVPNQAEVQKVLRASGHVSFETSLEETVKRVRARHAGGYDPARHAREAFLHASFNRDVSHIRGRANQNKAKKILDAQQRIHAIEGRIEGNKQAITNAETAITTLRAARRAMPLGMQRAKAWVKDETWTVAGRKIVAKKNARQQKANENRKAKKEEKIQKQRDAILASKASRDTAEQVTKLREAAMGLGAMYRSTLLSLDLATVPGLTTDFRTVIDKVKASANPEGFREGFADAWLRTRFAPDWILLKTAMDALMPTDERRRATEAWNRVWTVKNKYVAHFETLSMLTQRNEAIGALSYGGTLRAKHAAALPAYANLGTMDLTNRTGLEALLAVAHDIHAQSGDPDAEKRMLALAELISDDATLRTMTFGSTQGMLTFIRSAEQGRDRVRQDVDAKLAPVVAKLASAPTTDPLPVPVLNPQPHWTTVRRNRNPWIIATRILRDPAFAARTESDEQKATYAIAYGHLLASPTSPAMPTTILPVNLLDDPTAGTVNRATIAKAFTDPANPKP